MQKKKCEFKFEDYKYCLNVRKIENQIKVLKTS